VGWLVLAGFAFAAIGVKLLLGLWLVYALLPRSTACVHCDGDTLPLRPAAWIDAPLRLLRLGWRWCPACAGELLVRR
jgi:hypothetical protein